MSREYQFIQVLMPEEKLQGGLMLLTENEAPAWWPIMLVAQEPEDFSREWGIEFQESFDDLDRLKIAVLDLVSGTMVVLRRYRGAPLGGTDVCVAFDAMTRSQEINKEVMDTFGLCDADILWSQFADNK